MKKMAFACTMILSLCVAMSAPAGVDQTMSVDQARIAAATQGVAESRPGIEMLHGVVAGVDQGSDSIDIRLSPETTERFKVQDGLLFDAVRFGDFVGVSVQSIDGVRTIVGLE